MRMTRLFFISTKLDDLEHLEQDLEQAGIVTPQIHLLTEHEEEADRRHVHQVTPLMKSDVVHSTLLGAASESFFAGLELLVTFWPVCTRVQSAVCHLFSWQLHCLAFVSGWAVSGAFRPATHVSGNSTRR